MKDFLIGSILFIALSIPLYGAEMNAPLEPSQSIQCWLSETPLGSPTSHLPVTTADANATYWLNATGLEPSGIAKFVVKLPEGSYQRKLVRQHSGAGTSVYAPINLPATFVTLGSALLSVKDGVGKCTFPFTVGFPPFESGDSKRIPDGNGDFAASYVYVSSAVTSIEKVVVSVAIDHSSDSDLVISLISPTGRVVVLSTFRGGSGDNFGASTFSRTIFDDEATISLIDWIPPFDGAFRPEKPLSGFNGDNPNGFWTLKVADAYTNGQTGYIKGWSLVIK